MKFSYQRGWLITYRYIAFYVTENLVEPIKYVTPTGLAVVTDKKRGRLYFDKNGRCKGWSTITMVSYSEPPKRGTSVNVPAVVGAEETE